jgi:hypothetical protein
MNGETVVTILLLVFVVGMFTDFFGLGSLWTNRGDWYTVKADQLEDFMRRLCNLNAFMDPDGIPQEHVKVKAFPDNYAGDMIYHVKVPHWVFKYQTEKLDQKKRFELLGL